MHETREVAPLAGCLHRARAGERIERARQWLLEYADGGAGERQVVLALVDVAGGESLALTSGSREGVWMTARAAHWLARPGRRLWTMHNHPEGRSASPSAVLPSLLDVHMLAHPAIETVEVCTTQGLLSATSAGPVWARPDEDGALTRHARWSRAFETARRLCEGLAASAPVPWPQARRTAQAATLEALERAGIIRMTCSESLERLWAAHQDGPVLRAMRARVGESERLRLESASGSTRRRDREPAVERAS